MRAFFISDILGQLAQNRPRLLCVMPIPQFNFMPDRRILKLYLPAFGLAGI